MILFYNKKNQIFFNYKSINEVLHTHKQIIFNIKYICGWIIMLNQRVIPTPVKIEEEQSLKRRKLSVNSTGSDSTGDKNDLNESFKKLEIGSHSVIVNSTYQQFIPHKVIRPQVINRPQINQNLLQGIQKYLLLGDDQLEQCASDLLAGPQLQLQRILEQQKIKQEYERPKPFYLFGMPANLEKLSLEANFILQKEIIHEEQRQLKQTEGDKLENLLIQSTPGMIGRLTREEHQEKVRKFWEKKRNRLWQPVKYKERKILADKRDRVQGRFKKSDKPKYNELMTLSNDSNQFKKEDKDYRKQQIQLANSYDFNNSV
ncbi:hypothetical protein pb186bvf_005681 [Paramecium bursaria]